MHSRAKGMEDPIVVFWRVQAQGWTALSVRVNTKATKIGLWDLQGFVVL